MIRVFAALAGIGMLLSADPAAAAELDVDGYWWTPDRASVVRIHDCGDGTPCGTVAWIDRNGGGMTHDTHNPEGTLKGRGMVGVTLLDNFDRGEERWQDGRIYNPKDGRFYRARMELLSKDELAVSGCLGPICKKLLWIRADHFPTREAVRAEETGEDRASL